MEQIIPASSDTTTNLVLGVGDSLTGHWLATPLAISLALAIFCAASASVGPSEQARMSTTIAAGWSVPAGIAGPRRAGWSMRSASRRDPISARPTRRAPVLVRHAGGEGRRRWDTSSRTDRPRHKYRRFPYDSRRPDADHIGRNLGNESRHPSAPRIAPPFSSRPRLTPNGLPTAGVPQQLRDSRIGQLVD